MTDASLARRLARATEGYRPPLAEMDELLDGAGRLRPVWQAFVAHLATQTPEETAARLTRADRYLRDSGVFYRQYGAGGSVARPWPLSHLPVLIDRAEWDGIAAALVQRADLLEQVMADLYGPNRLVAEGHLPPALVAGNPEWLRPLVGIAPASGHFLHFVAFEIGRGPGGQWWVLADRTQAPSGAGYALENRVATTRAFADVYAAQNVQRLAGFFRDFREAMLGLRADREARVAILTPGPMNDTYFEQSFIARYLGFMLVEGEDLAVVNGRVMVRTVGGLRPVDVLWRRLDSSFADPVELDPASRLGAPGMVSALRSGGVTMVNALGSGVLETRALMAFLPRLAPVLLGAPLALPNIATWWCGGAAERAHVAAHPETLVLSPALATGVPFERPEACEPAAGLGPGTLAQRLDAGLVAQETVTLSTTPALIEGRLQPRPMSLRVFLARTPQGWQVMPGGFARIGASPGALAMQRGGAAADVWVIGGQEGPAPTLVPASGVQPLRLPPGALPARAADNLYWLGRYIERTEGFVRLLRSRNTRLAETGRADDPLLDALAPLMAVQGAAPTDPAIPPALIATLGRAIGAAGQVRDRFSSDAWAALADLDKTTRRMARSVTPGDDAVRALSALLRKLAGITGLVHENLYRFHGWRFVSIGRLQERAMGMSQTLAVLGDAQAVEGALDLAVELGDSVMVQRRRFSLGASRESVIDLLALDVMNPRAIRHQIDRLHDQVLGLPGADQQGRLSPLARATLRLSADLATAEPATLDTAALRALQERIGALSPLLAEAYLR